MRTRLAILTVVLLASPLGQATAVYLPGPAPGAASGTDRAGEVVLANRLLRATWQTTGGKVRLAGVAEAAGSPPGRLGGGELFRIVLADGRDLAASGMTPARPLRLQRVQGVPDALPAENRHAGWRVSGRFAAAEVDAAVAWSATLRDGANYVTTRVRLTAGAKGLALKELIVLDIAAAGVEAVGRVRGSPLAAGRWFLACEHPLAANRAAAGRAVGGRQRPPLRPAQSIELTAVIGLTPPGQLRRGFLHYLERRRAHPYRPFLHYNSWYHLNIGRPDNHMTEAECLQTIDHIGRELVVKRRTKLDAFVWDDGWDDFDSLWGFHKDFPDGFAPLIRRAGKYQARQGVWMSPWGGYGGPKRKRLAHGKREGYETNANGFSMAGPRYQAAFRGVCLDMMRRHGVVFFKFDGMGGGNLADDVDAVLELTRRLRRADPHLFISATVGTWPSPFWTLYADSVWRQGGDTGFHGAGNGRQRWITYRDMFACRHIARAAPLYPFNSLMLHGPCIGERANPAKMQREEPAVAQELWSFFGSGTGLQELYISPHLLTAGMWDELARAARWARDNADVLVDSHWIGGDPGAGEVYGFASWQPPKGIVVLRNPSEKPAGYDLLLARDLELPDAKLTDCVLRSVNRKPPAKPLRAAAVRPVRIHLKPFEVLVLEVAPAAGGKTYDAKAYRRELARQAAARAAANAEAAKKFVGVWAYTYKGGSYRREFLPDGEANLYINGKRHGAWAGSAWRAEGDRLIVVHPNGQTESHRLKDRDHLLLPLGLGVARRVKPDGK